MPDYIVKKAALPEFLKSLASGGTLLAPRGRGDQCRFEPASPDQIDLGYANTHMSPKGALFPQTEPLLAFHKDSSKPDAFVYQDLGDKASPTVLFGIRPCDAKGLSISNKVFQNDRFVDPYWKG